MTSSGVFYPETADTAVERLGYYSSRFPFVELDATYSALPSRRTARPYAFSTSARPDSS